MNFNSEQVPMMYRAQIDGHCNLQYPNKLLKKGVRC